MREIQLHSSPIHNVEWEGEFTMHKVKKMCILGGMLLLLSGCGKSSQGLDLMGTQTDSDRLIFGSFEGHNVSLGDAGLFYSKENLLRYYDMEKQEGFILCGRVNCAHNSEKCSAYFSSNLYSQSISGVAQVNGYLYGMFNGVTEEKMGAESQIAIELLQIDPNQGTRKTIASFPSVMAVSVNEDPEAFFASAYSDVSYCNGWAWFSLEMQQMDRGDGTVLSYSQLTGVNLESGEVVALNGYSDEWTYQFSCITPERIYFSRFCDTVPEMTAAEYYETYGTEPVTVDRNVWNSYEDYSRWHMMTVPFVDECYVYEIETGESRLLIAGESVLTTKQYRSIDADGEFQGSVLCYERLPDEQGQYHTDQMDYYLMDLQTGEKEWIPELSGIAPLDITQGFHANKVLSDGNFFFHRKVSDEQKDVYCYNFNTGEETFLFSEGAVSNFRIYGEYNGGYFGKCVVDDIGFYWISKADFFAGNFDGMIFYDVEY